MNGRSSLRLPVSFRLLTLLVLAAILTSSACSSGEGRSQRKDNSDSAEDKNPPIVITVAKAEAATKAKLEVLKTTLLAGSQVVVSLDAGDEVQKATFEIAQVVKGEGLVKTGDKFETLYFGDGSVGKSFLVMGIDPPKVMWSTPLPLTDTRGKTRPSSDSMVTSLSS